MKLNWLNQNKLNDKLIIFFSGWGGCKALVEHLECDDYDVLYIDDYRELSPIENIEHYQQRFLVGWSFGVASAHAWQNTFDISDDNFIKKIAINGSYIPVDKRLGIAPNVMQLTIDTLNEKSLKQFHRRCGIPAICQPKSIKELEAELITVRDNSYTAESVWNKVIISDADNIFPYKSLLRAWKQHSNLITNSEPHYPFQHWRNWHEIVDN